MKMILELFRIVAIFVLLGGLGQLLMNSIYQSDPSAGAYSWLGGVAILILLFVLYRNKLQFTGWYKGKGRVKLPHRVSQTLIAASVILLILPFALGPLLS